MWHWVHCCKDSHCVLAVHFVPCDGLLRWRDTCKRPRWYGERWAVSWKPICLRHWKAGLVCGNWAPDRLLRPPTLPISTGLFRYFHFQCLGNSLMPIIFLRKKFVLGRSSGLSLSVKVIYLSIPSCFFLFASPRAKVLTRGWNWATSCLCCFKVDWHLLLWGSIKLYCVLDSEVSDWLWHCVDLKNQFLPYSPCGLAWR